MRLAAMSAHVRLFRLRSGNVCALAHPGGAGARIRMIHATPLPHHLSTVDFRSALPALTARGVARGVQELLDGHGLCPLCRHPVEETLEVFL